MFETVYRIEDKTNGVQKDKYYSVRRANKYVILIRAECIAYNNV